jgi:hypothetical protein
MLSCEERRGFHRLRRFCFEFGVPPSGGKLANYRLKAELQAKEPTKNSGATSISVVNYAGHSQTNLTLVSVMTAEKPAIASLIAADVQSATAQYFDND